MNVQQHESMGPSLRPLMLGSVFSLIYVMYKGVTCFVFFLLVLPSLPPFWLDFLRYWVYVCCFVLLYFGCYVMMLCCVWKLKNVDNKKIVGRGSFCFNYCLNSAWHGGWSVCGTAEVVWKPRFLWQWPSAHLHFLVSCFSFSSWQYPVKHTNTMVI